jgi:putative tricarboxylic transport membrane protein
MILARASAAVLGLVAAGALIIALHLGLWVGGSPGPGLFPFVAALMLAGASLGAALQAEPDAPGSEAADRRRLFAYAGAVAAFGVVMKPLGMIIATIGLMLVVLRGIERRSWVVSVSFAILIAAFCWGLFKVLLGVPLPQGVLGV